VQLSRYTEPQQDILLAPWRDDFTPRTALLPSNAPFGHRDLGHKPSVTTASEDAHFMPKRVRELWIENLRTMSFSFIEIPAPKHLQPLDLQARRLSFPYRFSGIVFTVDELLG